MPTNSEFQRAITKLDSISRDMGRIAKILETFNANFVKFAQEFTDKDVDLDKLAEDVEKLRQIKSDTEEIRPFQLYDQVRVIDKNTIMHGKVGTVMVTQADGSVGVEFDNGLTCAEYSSRQVEKISVVRDANEVELPALVDDAKIGPNKFIPDSQGCLYPNEWRYNLGVHTIRVMKPDDPTLSVNENHTMTEGQFGVYNAALYARGIIMNEEDAEGTPDSLGRLKPYEWRHKLGLLKFNRHIDDGHEFDEDRVMTEEAFRVYNARLFSVEGTDE